MSFVVPNGLLRAVSAKTRAQIGRRNRMLALVDRSDESRFRAGEERLFMQRRTYSSNEPDTVGRASAEPAVAASTVRNWKTPKTLTASEITVSLKNGEELGVAIPRLDVMQSPLNEIENTRRFIAQSIDDEIEKDMVAFFLGLTVSNKATDNGNAGGVTKVNLGKSGSIFIKPPVAGNYSDQGTTGTGAGDLVLDAIDDFVLWAKDMNLLDGTTVYGNAPGMVYMVLPSYLMKYYVINQLREKGYSLDPLTSGTLRNNAVFTGEAFTAQLGVEQLTIICPNSIPDAAGNNDWSFWGGYTDAVVGGIGAMLTQAIDPVANQTSDGWVIRQVVNPYYNLLNGDAIRLYDIAQK